MKGIATERSLEITAAINLDPIADTGDGSAGRAIALGTVGKVLPTAFVAGVATHSGFPYNGLNAAVLLAAICARVEWAPELTDDTAGQPGAPPSLLSIKDGKSGYDVTTPATGFATWNVLFHKRSPEEILVAFEGLCRAAVLAAARRRCDVDGKLASLSAALAGTTLSLPERCGRATALVWQESGLQGPAVVVGYGSIPCLATHLSASAEARQLEDVVRDVAREVGTVTVTDYFAGISDMSFFGEAAENDLDAVVANTPLWGTAIRWPANGALAQVPTVNIGPWGRDYHTSLERLHIGYSFGLMPQLIKAVVERIQA